MIKTLPANVGDKRDVVSTPGLARFPEKEMVSHSSILVWEIQRQKSMVGYIQSMGSQRVRHD